MRHDLFRRFKGRFDWTLEFMVKHKVCNPFKWFLIKIKELNT